MAIISEDLYADEAATMAKVTEIFDELMCSDRITVSIYLLFYLDSLFSLNTLMWVCIFYDLCRLESFWALLQLTGQSSRVRNIM